MISNDRPLSAQVLLKTSDPRAEQQARGELLDAGFEAGPLVGNSFSISGAAKKFQSYFEIPPGSMPGAGTEGGLAAASSEYSLPMTKLSDAVKSNVTAIVFTKLPDFGPFGGY